MSILLEAYKKTAQLKENAAGPLVPQRINLKKPNTVPLTATLVLVSIVATAGTMLYFFQSQAPAQAAAVPQGEFQKKVSMLDALLAAAEQAHLQSQTRLKALEGKNTRLLNQKKELAELYRKARRQRSA